MRAHTGDIYDKSVPSAEAVHLFDKFLTDITELTPEIAVFGLIIAGLMYAFICKFMGYKPRADIIMAKKFFYLIQYVFILVKEIVKANFAVIRMITSSRYELEPAVVRFKTDLKSAPARIMLEFDKKLS